MEFMRHLALLLLVCGVFVPAGSRGRKLPLPDPAQLEWQDAELAALVCWDLHVFDGKRYRQGANRVTPIPDYNIFNPKQYDMDQWIRVLKTAGFKVAILTVTHETGFALYQSDVNPYCMKALKWREGKGDIFRDFVNACRKYGISPGVYIGIRWNAFLGVHDFMMPKDHSEFQKNRQFYYNRMCEGMTRELMTRYGDLSVVWYDGGGHGPELGGPDVLPIVEHYQKKIIFYHNSEKAGIRWGGSETGRVDYPCWGSYPFPYSHSKNQKVIFKNGFRLLKRGDPNGAYYMPAMGDFPLRGTRGRHEWFWEPGDEKTLYPLGRLMTIYRNCVGRNATLIGGITPDDRGLIPDCDARRLEEFGTEINRLYGKPFREVPVQDGKATLTFDRPQTLSHLVIQEDIARGERVRAYQIEALRGGKWTRIAAGSCIGHKRIEWLGKPIPVNGLRFTVTRSEGPARIKRLALFSTR